jgi:spore coat polysaccharide biosynthesis protein SpsF (cytidylyltransferase family)
MILIQSSINFLEDCIDGILYNNAKYNEIINQIIGYNQEIFKQNISQKLFDLLNV